MGYDLRKTRSNCDPGIGIHCFCREYYSTGGGTTPPNVTWRNLWGEWLGLHHLTSPASRMLVHFTWKNFCHTTTHFWMLAPGNRLDTCSHLPARFKKHSLQFGTKLSSQGRVEQLSQQRDLQFKTQRANPDISTWTRHSFFKKMFKTTQRCDESSCQNLNHPSRQN